MNYPPIRYKGRELHHNPKSVRIEESKHYKELSFMQQTGRIRELGRKARMITGEGEFCGQDCLIQYNTLLQLFKEADSGLLSVFGHAPFYASFVSLALTQPPLEKFLSYRFVFLEDISALKQGIAPKKETHTVKEKETLWDIAYLHGVAVESLLACNPAVRRPDVLTAGQKVVLP